MPYPAPDLLPREVLPERRGTAPQKVPSHLKYRLRNLAALRHLCPQLSDSLLLIFGCQRSGTTLLLSILNAHPQLTCVDETEFPSPYPFPSAQRLALCKLTGQSLCFKMLEHANKLDFLSQFYPHAKILWPLRNPHSAISSMLNLTNSEGDWIDRCADREMTRLRPFFPNELGNLPLSQYSKIEKAALYWRYKNQYSSQLKNCGFDLFTFKFEDLLQSQRATLQSITHFLNIPWSEDLLNFHSKNPGRSLAGGTQTNRPINGDRAANLQSRFSAKEIATINLICGPVMKTYGYSAL